ncbi:poly [ADP-ribose] polymerase [Teleopsis dalmanni]|uniref:poly [ADP-ribose] polymerase n=2 Tax=Teleopsis dalmanni TaxID=139649 RepID=UPI0018CF3E6B|nr:poly [ADP-ribose] polymerase [Teleopsis dalmanni]
MEVELPFKTEYAKSGRASCKGCKGNISQGSLRIAAMIQSAFHDGKSPNWFHASCFFKKQRPQSVGDIENFENLRFEDQELIRKRIEESVSVVEAKGSTKKGGKKRSNGEVEVLKDFGVEHAKSGRAMCRGCEQKITKGQIRVKKTVYDTEVGMKYGGQALWHHLECFASLRADLGWFASGEQLPGFKALEADAKDEVKKILPTIKSENASVPKKAKVEPQDAEDEIIEQNLIKSIKNQTKTLFEFRDNIKDLMSKNDKIELLQRNKQDPVQGDSEKLLDQLADMLTFGVISSCPECKGSQLLFQKSGYFCNGQLTEWTKCAHFIKEPKRTACKIPREFKKTYPFLSKVKKEPQIRAIRYVPPSSSTIAKNVPAKKDDESNGPKVKREKPPLYNLRFAHIGLSEQFENLKQRISKLGGSCDTKINEKVIAIFSTEKEVEKLSSRMLKAKELGIHIIPLKYLDSVEGSNAISNITSMSLCDWGTDPSTRVSQEEYKSGKSIYTKSVPKSITLKLKDGMAVDPDSSLQDIAHVYIKGKDKYNVVLCMTDIQKNKNSFYKLQLLESDYKNKFWVFRSWGRIGTTIGNHKLENYGTVFEAINAFEQIYLERTGNEFKDRDNFVKMAGRYYPLDIDYDDKSGVDLSAEHDIKSKLDPSIQNIIKLMFDINTMKRTMMEFNLDMEKMPLGKLSQKQIQSAYAVLSEISDLIKKDAIQTAFIDATNRFYTLIPHNFGVQKPPLLNTNEEITTLLQMLDSLMEIECAYNLIKSEENIKEDMNPIDKHYEQLKTKLEPLDKTSKEYEMLENYVKNTHADTHKMYELEIIDIFKVARQGESRRYKPFKKLHNRKLLWHGSRLTNFAGILSHGLKIAPPEAPATGYMFGKGIYFADMVSKSANYCFTSTQNNTGLMILSEVALGDMLECTSANFIKTLPNNKHSCFGRGRTMPNPKESYFREDGVEIPFGKPTTNNKLMSSLLYNEYIVYDIAQVNIQYLFHMNFNYKV